MKKRIFIILSVLVLTFSVIAVGCDGGNKTNKTEITPDMLTTVEDTKKADTIVEYSEKIIAGLVNVASIKADLNANADLSNTMSSIKANVTASAPVDFKLTKENDKTTFALNGFGASLEAKLDISNTNKEPDNSSQSMGFIINGNVMAKDNFMYNKYSNINTMTYQSSEAGAKPMTNVTKTYTAEKEDFQAIPPMDITEIINNIMDLVNKQPAPNPDTPAPSTPAPDDTNKPVDVQGTIKALVNFLVENKCLTIDVATYTGTEGSAIKVGAKVNLDFMVKNPLDVTVATANQVLEQICKLIQIPHTLSMFTDVSGEFYMDFNPDMSLKQIKVSAGIKADASQINVGIVNKDELQAAKESKQKIDVTLSLGLVTDTKEQVIVPTDADSYDGLTYSYDSENGEFYEVSSIHSDKDEIVIPSEFNGLPVKKIASGMMLEGKNPVNIVLPDSLESIRIYGLANTDKIKLNKKDNGCYLGSKTNPYMVLVKVEDRNADTFVIDANTKIIMNEAISCMPNITSIVIPKSVTSMNAPNFMHCDKLTTINCEADAQPDGWEDSWNVDYKEVVWGYKA